MKDIVRLKSYPNGIRIVIAEDALFGDVLAEVSEKFKDSERFFGKAKLSLLQIQFSRKPLWAPT